MILSIQQFHDWLFAAKHDEAIVYYTGPTPLIGTTPDVFDAARDASNSGEVALAQRLIHRGEKDIGRFEYIAQRTIRRKGARR